jgi:isocitrate dehydrogenase
LRNYKSDTKYLIPEDIKNENDKEIKSKYSKILGSAVNPVLRGNSDQSLKQLKSSKVHHTPWDLGLLTPKQKVATMESGDFYGTEKSLTIQKQLT